MQKQFLFILLSLFIFQSGFSQIVDVFTNKNYKISSFILDENIDADYVPEKFNIYQDKIKNPNPQWKKIDAEINRIALESIKNPVSFFEINAAVKKKLKVAEAISTNNRRENEQKFSEPTFQNLKIKMLSAVNDFAIYVLEYYFETKNLSNYNEQKRFVVKRYYTANINTGAVESLTIKPNTEQTKSLSVITNAQFQKIYLLQTEKLELNNLEKIKNPTLIHTPFTQKIDFSEAVIYPYAAGLIVEFEAFSEASKILDGKAFRVYLKTEELNVLIQKFPNLKKYFETKLAFPSNEIVKKLSDSLFNFERFRSGPEELDVLIFQDFNKKIYEMKIDNYQNLDTEKRFVGSKTFRFNEDESLHFIETSGIDNEISTIEKFTYNAINNLESETKTGYGNSLTLYLYENETLAYSEKIELEKNEDPYNSIPQNNLEIKQHHRIYNNNNRYNFYFNLVGDLSETVFSRNISGNTACTENYCFIFDEKHRIIGIKVEQIGSIEILTNPNGQILESYFDDNRHHYFFKYNSENSVKAIYHYENDNLKNTTLYEYPTAAMGNLKIIKKGQNTTEHVYSFKFWE